MCSGPLGLVVSSLKPFNNPKTWWQVVLLTFPSTVETASFPHFHFSSNAVSLSDRSVNTAVFLIFPQTPIERFTLPQHQEPLKASKQLLVSCNGLHEVYVVVFLRRLRLLTQLIYQPAHLSCGTLEAKTPFICSCLLSLAPHCYYEWAEVW